MKKVNRFLIRIANKLFFLDDNTYLKLQYRIRFNKKINLDEPKTFNEKLQWLKLNDRKEIYTTLVDKYEVKKEILNKIGEEYLIPTIGVYDKFEDIEFDKLPNQFVIKCTHDSGGVFICKDKSNFNIKSVRNKIKKHMKKNFYYHGREWPYKNVKPKIIIEKYMEDNVEKELIDYKVMCFNGEPKIIFTCTERFSDGLKVTFFDLNWKRLPFERHYPSSTKEIKKPYNLEKIIKLSKELSKNIPFVRIDWYEINQKLFFGEYTFFPGSGFEEFNPEEWDEKIGNMIDINNK